LWLGFIAFAVLLALAIPDDLYSRSGLVKYYADLVATCLDSINEFATHSRFPGTTRVVLAILWLCLPILTWIQWRYSGFLPNAERLGSSRIYLVAMIGMVIAIFPIFPMILEITPERLHEGTSMDIVLRLATSSRLAFGFVAGAYCVMAAWFLACLPMMVKRLISM
jgi:hypothetical protein